MWPLSSANTAQKHLWQCFQVGLRPRKLLTDPEAGSLVRVCGCSNMRIRSTQRRALPAGLRVQGWTPSPALGGCGTDRSATSELQGWAGRTYLPAPHLSRQGQVPCCGAKDGRGVRVGAQAPGPTLSGKVGGGLGAHHQFLGFLQPCCSLEPEGHHWPLETQQGGLDYKAP